MMCLIKAWRYIQVSFTPVLHLTEECTFIWRNVPSRNSGRKISFTWKYWRMHRGSCLEAIRSSFVDEVLCIRWERAPGSRKRFRSGFHLSEKTVLREIIETELAIILLNFIENAMTLLMSFGLIIYLKVASGLEEVRDARKGPLHLSSGF